MARAGVRCGVPETVEQRDEGSRRGAAKPEPLKDELLRDIGLVFARSKGDREQDWRESAQAAELAPEEIEESWAWFQRYAFEGPPVLEETAQQAARETMPDSVRRVLIYDPLLWFIGYDRDLLDEFELSIENDAQLVAEADDWRFWDDVGHAWTDSSSAEARQALDRLAELVHLKPEHTRDLARANSTTMAATKRRLIQEAVLLSLGAADERIRTGQRKVKEDPGHPITLEDVFGPVGLQDILSHLAGRHPEGTDDVRDELERSLGGPFKPASLTDRVIHRTWLTKEIRRRTVELLGQDLDIKDAGRMGGSRRKEIPYDETEPLAGIARGGVGTDRRHSRTTRCVRLASVKTRRRPPSARQTTIPSSSRRRRRRTALRRVSRTASTGTGRWSGSSESTRLRCSASTSHAC